MPIKKPVKKTKIHIRLQLIKFSNMTSELLYTWNHQSVIQDSIRWNERLFHAGVGDLASSIETADN
jgi:hypothetical protein